MNGQVARSNIKRFCSMPLLPDTFKCRTRSPSQDKRCFYLAVYLSRSGVQNIGLTSAPALETELELRAFCLVSILPRPITLIYFDPQERFRKLARERRDQRSRKKERQNESKRAAETVRRAASKTNVEIMLVLVQIDRRDQCASRT